MRDIIEWFKTFCVFFFFIMLGSALYKDLQPKDPTPIEQNWIDESTVCYYQGNRAINCQIVEIQ